MKRRHLFSLSLLAFAQNLSAAAPVTDEIVELPAFVVGDKTAHPIPWLFAEVPGIEILSCLPAGETARVVNALREQSRLLAWELPPELRSLSGRPAQLVLDDRALTSLRLPLSRSAPGPGGRQALIIGLVQHHWDFTSTYLNDGRGGASLFSGSQAALAKFAATQIGAASFGLISQTPVPPWLVRFWGGVGVDRYARGDSVTFPEADKNQPWPGLAAAFAEPKPATANADATGQWLVRWALYADEGAHRTAFWNFVQAATLQPEVNDTLVRQHFNLSLAELDERVGRLRKQIQAAPDLRLRIPLGPIPVTSAIRVASETEIARILGQWTLLALRKNPALAVTLSATARRVLDRSRQQSGGNAQLTALLGLVELEAGNTEQARTLLESVSESAGLDARSRFELARLRYAAALEKPAAAGGKFDPAQVAAILAPLAPFRLKPPGNADPLALVAQTWLRAAEKPARGELAAFALVARQFPRHVELLLPTAQLCFDQNLDHEARELATTALQTAQPEPAVRAALLALKEEIDARAPPKK